MLAQVSLLDSLDSTLEKKHLQGVQRSPNEKLSIENTIHENTGEQRASSSYDSIDGQRLDERQNGELPGNEAESDNMHGTDTTTKGGVTSKMGLGYTDTSHEMEAYRRELRKFGGTEETFESTNDFTLHDSSAVGPGGSIQRTSVGRTQTNGNIPQFLLGMETAGEKFTQQQPSVRFKEQTQEYSLSCSLPSRDNFASGDTRGSLLTAASDRMPTVNDDASPEPSPARRNIQNSKVSTALKRSKNQHLPPAHGTKNGGRKSFTPPSSLTPEIKLKKNKATVGKQIASRTLLSSANTRTDLFGVQTSTKRSPVILVNGKDQSDLQEMLEQDDRHWQELLMQERDKRAKEQDEFASKESDYINTIKEMKQEMLKLKQENFILSAKVPEAGREAHYKSLVDMRKSGEVSLDMLARLEEDIRQQESLLVGYQTENEKMCKEIKRLQLANKSTEERMFRENQKLKIDLANLREGYTREESHHDTPMAKISDHVVSRLEEELQQTKAKVEVSQREIDLLTQTKMDMANQIDHLSEKLRSAEEERKQFQNSAQARSKQRPWPKKPTESEKSASTRKIADLERQVKEMENILKRRYPNSIPALMWAAAAASEDGKTKSQSVQYLEGRIQKLEKEVESKDDEAKRSLRAMEQKFNSVKLKYEERIIELESTLARHDRSDLENVPHANVVVLMTELDKVRDNHRKEVAELQNLVDNLRKELTLRNDAAPTVAIGNGKKCVASNKINGNRSLPSYTDDVTIAKQYSPDMFTGQHVSELLRENSNLLIQVDSLQLELDQRRVAASKSIAEAEANERRLVEAFEEQISAMKFTHTRELQEMRTRNAVEYAGSRTVELQSKLKAQELIILHMREQLAQSVVDRDQLSRLSIEKITLENQTKQLTEDLANAKRSHTPQMRHFESLQEKIETMERQHLQREERLRDIMKHHQTTSVQELTDETIKWKRIVENKNLEIEKFRNELDSILNILKELQVQGIVIPYRDTFAGQY